VAYCVLTNKPIVTTSNPVSAHPPKAPNLIEKTPSRAVPPSAIQPSNSNRPASEPHQPPKNSSWLGWFGFGQKPVEPVPQPVPQPALRSRTLVHRSQVFTGPCSSSDIHQPILAPSSVTIRAPVVPTGTACPPQPLAPQNTSTATKSLVSKTKTTIHVKVQAIEQPNPVEPNPDPCSPVPSLSWLLEDDEDDKDSPSEHQTTTVVSNDTTVEQGRPPKPPNPSTNIHSLFPPLPPHIPPPGPQVHSVLAVAKSVYDAQKPGVRRDRIPLLVPHAFRQSCPEYHLVDGLRNLDGGCERLKAGFVKLGIFYEEVNRKPDNTNPSPEFFPPSPEFQFPRASWLSLIQMLMHIVELKWILHVLYDTTVGMTGFLRADDPRPITPEETRIYIQMRDEIRRYTDRARGSYVPPAGVRPKNKLDLDEVRRLVEMLISAGGEMFTDDMGKPVAALPTIAPAGPFLVANPPNTAAASTSAPIPVQEATTLSQTPATSGLAVALPSLEVPPPAYEANSGVTLGSTTPSQRSPCTSDSTATLKLPDRLVPIWDSQGNVRWSDPQTQEDALWPGPIAEDRLCHFVEQVMQDDPILSALLPMAAGDDLRTKVALALVVQQHPRKFVPEEREDMERAGELLDSFSGAEALLGMLDILKDVGEQLKSPDANASALDGYVKQKLLNVLKKRSEVKPELAQGSSCLEKTICMLFYHISRV
jgi:hypothetical protein